MFVLINKVFERFLEWLFRRNDILNTAVAQLNVQTCMAMEQLKNMPKYSAPRSLGRFAAKAYSQNDEDGIIQEIFKRIGVTNKTFIEFGIGDGLECNSFNLLLSGWNGLWIEGSAKSCDAIKKGLPKLIQTGKLKVENSFITKDNINSLIARNLGNEQREIDLLVIDIDGNDYHVWKQISCVKPRVVIFEYNAKFLPGTKWCMEYREDHTWGYNDAFGVSLSFLEVKLADAGYSLVGCNLTGCNAFFVRNDLLQDKFLAPCTAEHHYEPARYFALKSGHPASYSVLERSISV